MKSIFKSKSTKIVITLLFCIITIFFLSTIAYSAFSSTMNITGLAHSRVEADTRITNFTVDEIVNATSSYEEFGKDHISTSISFQENAYAIYKVEVTNYAETEVGIYSIDGIPDEITYELVNYNLKDKLCNVNGKCNNYATKVFYIKLQGNNLSKDINLSFNFRVFRKITYINFSNDYVSEIMDGDSLEIDLSADSPKLVAVTPSNNIDYIYTNNILSVTNITSDLIIEAIYNTEYEYNYTGNYQTFTVPHDGIYKIELWGAAGGADMENATLYKNENGLGGYTSGEISLNKNTNLYIYVGGKGKDAVLLGNALGGYNGGGSGSNDDSDDEASGGGGGATDIRLVSGIWNNEASLKSRIMVAGGGASEKIWIGFLSSLFYYTSPYCAAGGLQGYTMVSTSSPGTQTTGYKFGIGQDGIGASTDSGDGGGNSGLGGGGGGYYGGTIGKTDYLDIGAGGSSFISGHSGCVAIESASSLTPKKGMYDNTCTDGTTDIICSYHYSGNSFMNTTIVDGAGYNWTTVKGSKTGMPTHDGASTMNGNSGNGYAKITLLDTITEYNITYVNITGNYQTRIKAGKDLVVNFGNNAPLKVEVRVANQKVEHTYQNNVLTVKNIQGNVTINPIKTVYEYSYTGNSQTFTVPYKGVYKVELWGAKGGKGRTDGVQKYAGGMGGYTSGNVILNENEQIFIYVGGSGGDAPDSASGGTAGYNGGGKGGNDSNPGTANEPGGGGGGATDIRINGTSLNDRIMVAAGGGGSAYNGAGGSGGGLSGKTGNTTAAAGGSQTTGYSFGQGGPGLAFTGGTGAGGGGYWGGKAAPDNGNSGGGGSSFISGHTGAISVISSTSTAPRQSSTGTECTEETTDITCSYHYSGKIFSNTSTIIGGNTMPNYAGTGTMSGNNGNGYAKITLLELK